MIPEIIYKKFDDFVKSFLVFLQFLQNCCLVFEAIRFIFSRLPVLNAAT